MLLLNPRTRVISTHLILKQLIMLSIKKIDVSSLAVNLLQNY